VADADYDVRAAIAQSDLSIDAALKAIGEPPPAELVRATAAPPPATITARAHTRTEPMHTASARPRLRPRPHARHPLLPHGAAFPFVRACFAASFLTPTSGAKTLLVASSTNGPNRCRALLPCLSPGPQPVAPAWIRGNAWIVLILPLGPFA
jgi:chemotaxis response regulator CheB